MTTLPILYRWDFDRSREKDIAGLDATTFSVGLFQWLPTASGKGFKKSKTIRVLGYVVEPQRVFEKAEVLCRRLNDENVRLDCAPTWLQKQYSVPAPAKLVFEQATDELTAAQVRSIRNEAMRRSLLQHGFVKATPATYAREVETQIHLVHFQGYGHGHKYRVHVGFHYSFVPGFFTTRHLRVEEFQLLDCAFQSGLDELVPDKASQWYPYGNDRYALLQTFLQNAEFCLSQFECCRREWRSPELWVSDRVPDCAALQKLAQPWRIDFPHLLRGCIAARIGRASFAHDEFKKHIEWASDERWATAFRQQVMDCYAAINSDPVL